MKGVWGQTLSAWSGRWLARQEPSAVTRKTKSPGHHTRLEAFDGGESASLCGPPLTRFDACHGVQVSSSNPIPPVPGGRHGASVQLYRLRSRRHCSDKGCEESWTPGRCRPPNKREASRFAAHPAAVTTRERNRNRTIEKPPFRSSCRQFFQKPCRACSAAHFPVTSPRPGSFPARGRPGPTFSTRRRHSSVSWHPGRLVLCARRSCLVNRRAPNRHSPVGRVTLHPVVDAALAKGDQYLFRGVHQKEHPHEPSVGHGRRIFRADFPAGLPEHAHDVVASDFDIQDASLSA